jgi:hypothetical protein
MTIMEFWKGGAMIYRFNLELKEDVYDLAKYLTMDDDELSVRLIDDEWVD